MRENADKEAFEKKLRITPGCWIWQGPVISKGYGRFEFPGGYEAAHRKSYKLYVGDIPEGNVVRHKCDNPICVNPDHLLIGTQKDNIQDAVSRGRMSIGSRNGRAVVTEEIAKQILDLVRCGLFTQGSIAFWYRVNVSLVCKIKLRKSWTHLP